MDEASDNPGGGLECDAPDDPAVELRPERLRALSEADLGGPLESATVLIIGAESPWAGSWPMRRPAARPADWCWPTPTRSG